MRGSLLLTALLPACASAPLVDGLGSGAGPPSPIAASSSGAGGGDEPPLPAALIARIPDGSAATHDGYFFAADRGGAIKAEHIDVFVGIGKNNPFDFVKSRSSATFAAHIVARDQVEEAHRRLSAAHNAFVGR